MATLAKAVPGAVSGRPTVLPLERASDIFELTALGFTRQDIADRFGIHLSTLERRSREYPQFREALKEGRIECARRRAAVAEAKAAAVEATRRQEVNQRAAAVTVLLSTGAPNATSSPSPLPQAPMPQPVVARDPYGRDEESRGDALPLSDPLAAWRQT